MTEAAKVWHAHLSPCGHIQNISKQEYTEFIAMLYCRACQAMREVERRCGRSA